MKIFKHKSLLLFLSLLVFLFVQQIQAQKKSNYITLHEIKSKLIALIFKDVPKDEANKQLQEEIQKRKVDFVLLMEDRVSLKEIGGSDLLIEVIRNNTSKKAGELLKEYERVEEAKIVYQRYVEEARIVYQRYIDNYSGNKEQKRIAVEAAKEFLIKYSDLEEYKEQTDYLKRAIPKLEQEIKSLP